MDAQEVYLKLVDQKFQSQQEEKAKMIAEYQNTLKGFLDLVHDCNPPKPSWELGRFAHLEDARSFAIENGWRANPQKVQLKAVTEKGYQEYIVEPFEEDCRCPGIVQPF